MLLSNQGQSSPPTNASPSIIYSSPSITHQPLHKTFSKFEEDFERNKWTAPDCNHFEMSQKIKLITNGHGGDLNHSFFYFDTKGAENWLTISGTQDYQLNTKHDIPFEQIANAIYHHHRRSSFDKNHIRILGLGCGDGSNEIKLVQRLLDRMPNICIHLYLLDLSPSLLNFAHHSAAQAFAKKPQVKVTSLEANFENLSSYQPIINMVQNSNHQVVLSLLGRTFVNVKNERIFVRNALRVFKPNTLFLIDVDIARAQTDRPEEIKKVEPWLSTGMPYQDTPEVLDFLKGPFTQYRENIEHIDFRYVLDYSTCFEGSYAVAIQAVVDNKASFTAFYLKRYDPIKLGELLLKEGWASVQGFRYGTSQPCMIYLTHKI